MSPTAGSIASSPPPCAPRAPRARRRRGPADPLGVHLGGVAAGGCGKILSLARLGEPRRVVHHARVAALAGDDFPEFFCRRPAADQLVEARPSPLAPVRP